MPPTPPPRPAVATRPRGAAGVGWWLALVGVTSLILLLLAGLLALRVPVSMITRNMDVPPAVVALHGSASRGRATLEGGYVLRWTSGAHLFPFPHLRSDLTLEGPDTRLGGRASAGLTGLSLHDIEGRAGPGLAQLVPGAWSCDMTARVSGVSVDWGWRTAGASGDIATPAGTCTRGTRDAAIPALALDLSTSDGDALGVLSAAGAAPMAEVRISRDRLIDIAIQPSAADVFPALPRGGPITLQLPF